MTAKKQIKCRVCKGLSKACDICDGTGLVESSGQGFASMPPEQRSRIAKLGGLAAQKSGKAHRWTSEEAREAGKKGGARSQELGTGHRFNSETSKKAAKKRWKK